MSENKKGPEQRWRLDGKRALVTGGTKGIGAAIAHELLSLGATVTIVARDAQAVADWAAGAESASEKRFGIGADLSTSAGRQTAITFAAEQMNGLDILINNVGTNIRKPSTAYNEDEYAHVFATNLTSAWEMCRAAYPLLKQSDAASIVQIGSVAGSVSVGSGGPYAMTKAALDQMTRYLAVEWAGNGIRINNVNPGYTRTPLTDTVLQNDDFVAKILAHTPNRVIADPEDMAGLVAFLCLPAARHITGQTIAVDGGFLARGMA